MRVEVLVFCEDCPSRRACDTPEYRCDVVRMIARSTQAQGLPFHVTDPETLRRVATLLGVADC